MNENDEQLELLKEINYRLNRIEKFQRVERARRIVILCAVLAALVVLAIIVVPKITALYRSYNEISAQVNALAEQLSGIDMNQVNEALGKLKDVDTEVFNKVLESLEGLAGMFNFGSLFGN